MGVEVSPPFPRIPYDEAIARFGTDRPDTRFGLEITDLTDILEGTEFKAFGGGDRIRRGRHGASTPDGASCRGPSSTA